MVTAAALSADGRPWEVEARAAGGGGSTLWAWDGHAWSEHTDGAIADGPPPLLERGGDELVLPVAGAVLRGDGLRWTRDPFPLGVSGWWWLWGAAARDLWGANNGVVYHFDGAGWTAAGPVERGFLGGAAAGAPWFASARRLLHRLGAAAPAYAQPFTDEEVRVVW